MKKFLESKKAQKYNIDSQLIELVKNAPSIYAEKIEILKEMIVDGTYLISIDHLISSLLKKTIFQG
ncbi:flagellar biosynthesis anti-sigma factor FlgM [bacterium]|nr:flagellar biosynthesis anti-sigma factor FlgM [bacterium]